MSIVLGKQQKQSDGIVPLGGGNKSKGLSWKLAGYSEAEVYLRPVVLA
jgi:hypothetical protein